MGYVVGGLIAGLAADALGYGGAIAIVAGLTAASGLWVAGRSARHDATRRHAKRGRVMSELTPERVTAFFDRVASDWDQMRLVYYDEAVIEQLAAAAELDATMTVADVGTGTGFVAAGLAGQRRARHRHRRLGRDARRGASSNLARISASPTSSCAAATSPPSRSHDDSVDAAVANMVLHHATDPAAMLRGDGARRPPRRDRRDLRRGRTPVRLDARGAPRRLARLQPSASQRVLHRRRPRSARASRSLGRQ